MPFKKPFEKDRNPLKKPFKKDRKPKTSLKKALKCLSKRIGTGTYLLQGDFLTARLHQAKPAERARASAACRSHTKP